MEEAFNNVDVQEFKVHLIEKENEHTAIVSKKSSSHREHSVILPKSTKIGVKIWKVHMWISKEGRNPMSTHGGCM